MVQAAEPRHHALDAHAEPGVGDRAVAAEVEVPSERVLRETVGADAGREHLEIVLALAPADDLAVAFGCQHVDAQRQPRIGRIGLHVEGLRGRRIAVHQDRPIEALREHRLLVAAEVVAERDRLAVGREERDRVLVAHARKRFLYFRERRRVALEEGELRLALLHHAPDDFDQEVLGERHVVVEVGEGDLGLDHPELREVTAGLRLLGTEGRAETVDLAEGHRAGLHVELAALGEVGLVVEIADLEERRRALAGGGGEDRGIDQREAAAVEVVAAGADHARPDAHDGVLARGAEPEVAVVEQERGAVLLRRDRVLARFLQHAHVLHGELEAERRARVGGWCR